MLMLPSSFPAEQETRLSMAAKTKATKAGAYLNILKTEGGGQKILFHKKQYNYIALKKQVGQ